MSYYYDVSTTCGCLKCGKLTTFDIDTINNTIGDDDYPQICNSCIRILIADKYYSLKVIRDQKIDNYLKNWWEFWK